MKFIKLTYLDNTNCYINMSSVTAFEQVRDKTIMTILGLDDVIHIKETPTEILSLIYEQN